MSSNPVETVDGVDKLLQEPYQFDFVQAVRQLYRHAVSTEFENQRVGWDNFPEQEVVRFNVSPSLRHSASQVISVTAPIDSSCSYRVTIPFMGLIGASGVLPYHYRRMVISRVKEKDYAMRDFFDLFHHRIVSNFFRASVKYRLPILYEMALISKVEKDDVVTQALKCLTGMGESQVKNRLPYSDNVPVFYCGHFSREIPSAHALEQMLTEFIGVDCEVLQFQLEWLYIDPEEQTCLRLNSDSKLGMNVVIGEKVPSYQNRFRVRIGPLKWDAFSDYLPKTERVNKIATFIRSYVGIAYDFDLQVTVKGSEIPELELGGPQPAMLGWNSWVTSEAPAGVVEDAVFDVG